MEWRPWLEATYRDGRGMLHGWVTHFDPADVLQYPEAAQAWLEAVQRGVTRGMWPETAAKLTWQVCWPSFGPYANQRP